MEKSPIAPSPLHAASAPLGAGGPSAGGEPRRGPATGFPGAPPRGPAGPLAPPGPPLGLANILALIRRVIGQWPIMLIVLVLGCAVTLKFVRARKPVYRSEAIIFYRPGAITTDSQQNLGDTLRTLGQKLKEMLLAKSNLQIVIDRFDLFKDVVQTRGYPDAVEGLRKRIDFKARTNDTFAISYDGPTREEAQAVTQGLAEMIVEQNAKSRKERAKDAKEFLTAEKKRIDEEVAKVEQDLAKFLTEHPEFATGGPGAAIREQQKKIGAAQSEQQAAARRRAMLLGIGRSPAGSVVPSFGGPHGVTAAPVDPVLIAQHSQAMSELIAAKKDFGEKSLRYTEQHPDVRAASARLAAAESALQKAEAAIRAAQPPPVVDDPYGGDDAPEPAAAPKVVGMGPAPKSEPIEQQPESALIDLETQWARLSRTATNAREQQKQMETRLFSAEIAMSSEVGGYAATIVILEPAYRPSGPTGQPNSRFALAGLAASLVIGLGLAAARGIFLDDRIYDPCEIEGLGLTPVIGVVPRAKAPKGGRKKRELPRFLRLWRLRG